MTLPFEKDIKRAGGPQCLADKIGVSIQRLSNWRKRGGVPADMVLNYCAALEWKTIPHQVRPDLYPHPDDGLPPELRSSPSSVERSGSDLAA